GADHLVGGQPAQLGGRVEDVGPVACGVGLPQLGQLLVGVGLAGGFGVGGDDGLPGLADHVGSGLFGGAGGDGAHQSAVSVTASASECLAGFARVGVLGCAFGGVAGVEGAGAGDVAGGADELAGEVVALPVVSVGVFLEEGGHLVFGGLLDAGD